MKLVGNKLHLRVITELKSDRAIVTNYIDLGEADENVVTGFINAWKTYILKNGWEQFRALKYNI